MTLFDPRRRRLLIGLASSPLAAGIALPLRAQTAAEGAARAAGLVSANVCMLQAEVTEGPYYLDPGLVRADITEDREGVAMDLVLQVVTADCVPVEGARVDVWHCDAEGNYSGFAGQGSDVAEDTAGETYLRGTQMTAADGQVTFRTIYPGWYRGRTTHIHYKIFLDETTVLTSQIFFPDALSQYLFETVAPYDARPADRDTTNTTDAIAAEAGEGAYAAIREASDRYVAALVVGISPDAVSAQGGPGGLPPGGPPPDGAGGPRSTNGDGRTGNLVPGKG